MDGQSAEVTDPQVAADLKKRRTFRTFSYRGVELEKLLDLSNEEVRLSLCALTQRRFDMTCSSLRCATLVLDFE